MTDVRLFSDQSGARPAPWREALQLAEQVDEPRLLSPCYDGLAALFWLDAGDAVNAEAYLGEARMVCERAGLEPDALMVLPLNG